MLAKGYVIKERDYSLVKSLIARKMHEKGHTQSEISKLLEITQPMVSNYLKQKETNKRIEEISDKIAEEIKDICFSLLITNKKMENGEYYACTKEHILSDEKIKVINNIQEAVSLLKNEDISKVLPKVKMNIAMSMENAKSREDVAALPSGLITVNGEIKSYLEPEFGTSHHLSKILLKMKEKDREINAVLNVKYNDYLKKTIKNMKVCKVGNEKECDILIDEGDFGIEPCAYILGKDALDTVKKLKKIL